MKEGIAGVKHPVYKHTKPLSGLLGLLIHEL